MDQTTNTEQKDQQLWAIARKRANFKTSLITYLIVNAFIWGFWFITNGRFVKGHLPWPLWVTLGWGIGLIFQFFGAYVYPKDNSVETEYEKLKRKN